MSRHKDRCKMSNSNTSCACLCDGNGETLERHSGDGDFDMMKAQWSFVLHVFPHSLPPHKRSLWIHRCCVGICNGAVACGNDVMGCAFWSISTKVEWFRGLKYKRLNCATHKTLIRCNSLTMVHNVIWDRRYVQRHHECFV